MPCPKLEERESVSVPLPCQMSPNRCPNWHRPRHLLVAHANFWGGNALAGAYLHLTLVPTKEQLGSPQFTRFLVLAMCPSSCCIFLWTEGMRRSSRYLMRLKQGYPTRFMVVSRPFSLCNSRFYNNFKVLVPIYIHVYTSDLDLLTWTIFISKYNYINK